MLSEQKSIVYFGPNIDIAECLNRYSSLQAVVTQKKQFNPDIYSFCRLYGIEFLCPGTSGEIDLSEREFDLGVSYGGGLILKRVHINQFRNGVINFHPGKLPDYRGRHPIGWAIIENQPLIFITAHLIDENIDQGWILDEEPVPVSINDTEKDISVRVSNILVDKMIPKILNISNYVPYRKVSEGRYLPSLKGLYNKIDPETVSSKELYNIVRAKSDFGGVIVAEVAYTQCQFLYEDQPDLSGEGKVVRCADGVRLVLT
jgi:methionyl-tRNA formyltransferase